jgi:hypothetical protein
MGGSLRCGWDRVAVCFELPDGRCYLPDFWLPRLETFVETKPTIEACSEAEPIMQALVSATGQCGLLIAGSPNIAGPLSVKRILPDGTDAFSTEVSWRQCPLCDRVGIDFAHGNYACDCKPSVEILKLPFQRDPGGPRVEYAMAEAQRARFEHGEDGRPRPYVFTDDASPVHALAANAATPQQFVAALIAGNTTLAVPTTARVDGARCFAVPAGVLAVTATLRESITLKLAGAGLVDSWRLTNLYSFADGYDPAAPLQRVMQTRSMVGTLSTQGLLGDD